jgi:hypothetical protein
MPTQEDLLQEFEGYARKATDSKTLMQHMSDRLHHEKARYNWVGFYLMAAPAYDMLVLGLTSAASWDAAHSPRSGTLRRGGDSAQNGGGQRRAT